jgi:hypothetical protein
MLDSSQYFCVCFWNTKDLITKANIPIDQNSKQKTYLSESERKLVRPWNIRSPDYWSPSCHCHRTGTLNDKICFHFVFILLVALQSGQLNFFTLSMVWYSKKTHNVSKTRSVFVLRCREGGHLLSWVRLKELTSITGQPKSEQLHVYKHLKSGFVNGR